MVVVSLVRCNKNGNIGFLKDKKRITAMLSRARSTFIMIGSRETLSSSAAWRRLFKDLDRGAMWLKGFLLSVSNIQPRNQCSVVH